MPSGPGGPRRPTLIATSCQDPLPDPSGTPLGLDFAHFLMISQGFLGLFVMIFPESLGIFFMILQGSLGRFFRIFQGSLALALIFFWVR